ncbi:fatty acid desaturase [Methylocystis parvus]|uniref:Fatty acid desaturase n=1 Tax=Methylocystis parvus TaxID=134 RepID=A0A6B8M864_9HYPH|nr:fatty acid desaturase [Methylocystis parvus]QGM98595.1 fatty acid desaturase [Methylocystis parvus]WBK01062.1 fatty acid desaturase [Methylocystis parvus OBBP]
MSVADYLTKNGFCRREDVSCIALSFILPALFFVPFIFDFTVLQAAAYVALFTAVDGRLNYLLHWHVHRPFTTSPPVNLLIDFLLGAATGVTASNWRIQHVHGHHAGKDEAYRAPGANMSAPYSARYAIAFCFGSLWPSMAAPLAEAFKKGVRGDVAGPINYRWAFAEQCLFLAFVAALGFWRPGLTLFVLVPWHLAMVFCTRYVDYMNHYGCDESGVDPMALANNTLHAGYNAVSGNLGYHTAHHHDPSGHWADLPLRHAEIASRVPAGHVKEFSWSFLNFPYHAFLARRSRM